MARFSKVDQGKKLYLAHSSLDKGYVRRIHADLKRLGHNPWLDEIEIKVGESIVEKIPWDPIIRFHDPSYVRKCRAIRMDEIGMADKILARSFVRQHENSGEYN